MCHWSLFIPPENMIKNLLFSNKFLSNYKLQIFNADIAQLNLKQVVK